MNPLLVPMVMLPMCFPSLNLQSVKSKIISWFWQLNCDNLLKNRDYSDRLRVFWPLKYCCLISDDLYFANKILNDEIPDNLTRSVSFNSFFHCIFWGGIWFPHFFGKLKVGAEICIASLPTMTLLLFHLGFQRNIFLLFFSLFSDNKNRPTMYYS